MTGRAQDRSERGRTAPVLRAPRTPAPRTPAPCARLLLAAVTAVVVSVVGLARVGRGPRINAMAPGNDPSPASTVLAHNATVESVVDGDTVDVRVGGRHSRVRLIGVNTPETVDPRRGVECFGPEAKEFTARALPPGTRIRLERDIEPRDDYGRLLAYVYRSSDGTMVNLALVAGGYAVPLRIEPNTAHADRFRDAALSAQRSQRGLWSACPGKVTT